MVTERSVARCFRLTADSGVSGRADIGSKFLASTARYRCSVMVNSTSTRRSVAHQVKPTCNASTGVRQRCRQGVVQTFCTSLKRPETGRSRRRPGHHDRPAGEWPGGHANARRLAWKSGIGPQQKTVKFWGLRLRVELAADRSGSGHAAQLPRAARSVRPGIDKEETANSSRASHSGKTTPRQRRARRPHRHESHL